MHCFTYSCIRRKFRFCAGRRSGPKGPLTVLPRSGPRELPAILITCGNFPERRWLFWRYFLHLARKQSGRGSKTRRHGLERLRKSLGVAPKRSKKVWQRLEKVVIRNGLREARKLQNDLGVVPSRNTQRNTGLWEGPERPLGSRWEAPARQLEKSRGSDHTIHTLTRLATIAWRPYRDGRQALQFSRACHGFARVQRRPLGGGRVSRFGFRYRVYLE